MANVQLHQSARVAPVDLKVTSIMYSCIIFQYYRRPLVSDTAKPIVMGDRESVVFLPGEESDVSGF